MPEGPDSRLVRVLDSPVTRGLLWAVAGLVAAGALWVAGRYLPSHDAPDGFGTDEPKHGGLIFGQLVAAAAFSGSLVILAALIPANERRRTSKGTYALFGTTALIAALVLIGIDVLGPDLAATVNEN